MTLNPFAILRDSAVLWVACFVWLYVDLFAANVAARTAFFLFFPEQASWIAAGGEVTNPWFFVANAYSITASLVFALVAVGVVKRLWFRLGRDAAPGPAGVAAWAPIFGVSLLLDHVMTAALLFFLIPGLLLSAVTTTVMPALVLERRGWGALARSVEMTRGHLLPLTILWSVVLIPWLAIIFTRGPRTQREEVPITDLWVSTLFADLHVPAFVGFSLCLTMTVYRRLTEAEGGGPPERLDDIFE